MYIINNETTRNAVYNALSGSTREFSNRLIIGHFNNSTNPQNFVPEYTVTSLTSLTVTQNACASTELSIGGFPTQSMNCEFNNTLQSGGSRVTNFKNKICKIECGVKYNNGASVFYVPVGYFKVEKAQTENEWLTVSLTGNDISAQWTETYETELPAYGELVNGSQYQGHLYAKALLDELTFNKHISLVLSSAAQTALTAREISTTDKAKLQEISVKDAVSMLAGIVGCNARINTQNQLYIGYFEGAGIVVPRTVQWQGGFKKQADTNFVIYSVTSSDNENGNESYTAGSGVGISFANILITHSEIEALQSALVQKSFMPCTLEWRGNPCVEAGDAITVKYLPQTGNPPEDTGYTVYVVSQTIDLLGGLSMSVTAPVAQEDVNFATVDYKIKKEKGYIDDAIKAATDAINGAEGGYVEINDTDNPPDGNPDEILIKENEDGSGKIIRMNKNGIGYSEDGGNNYTVAITGKGITAAAITAGTISADRIGANSISTDKLAVGDGYYNEMYTNPDFAFGAVGSSDSYANWNGYNAKFVAAGTADNRYVWVDPVSQTNKYCYIEQFVYLESGKTYMFNSMFAFQSSFTYTLQNNANFGLSVGLNAASLFPTAAQIEANKGTYVNYRCIFNYTGQTGYVNVGLYHQGILKNTNNAEASITLNWLSLCEIPKQSNDTYLQFCSVDYGQSTTVIPFARDRNAHLKTAGLTIDKSGNLASHGSIYAQKGDMGKLKFAGDEVNINGQVTYETGDDKIFMATNIKFVSNNADNPQAKGTSHQVDNLSPYFSRIELSSNEATLKNDGTLPTLSDNGKVIITPNGIYMDDGGSYYAQVMPSSVQAVAFQCGSSEKIKDNIKAAPTVLKKLKESVIYDYKLKDSKTAEKHYGFVIERETPQELVSPDGTAVDLYSMCSMLWKATQELLNKVENLEKKIGSDEK